MPSPALRFVSLIIICLGIASVSRAEEPTIPVRIQASLIAKLADYDRNMRARAGERMRIGILVKPSEPDSVRAAKEVARALEDIDAIAGLPHEEVSLSYVNSAELAKAMREQRFSILYVTPGFESEVPKIAQALSGADLLTVSAVAGYVRSGIVVGFDLLGGRPRMLVHLSQARAQHVEFQATVLRLMTVYE